MIYFINDGNYLGRTDPHNIRVRIDHQLSDGYLLSADGETIHEELRLIEFARRLTTISSAKEAEEAYIINQVISAYKSGPSKLEAVAKWLDHRYMDLIRSEKIVLAQHKISTRQRHNRYLDSMERESISNTERTITQTQPLTPKECWSKEDMEIYYSITP